MEKEMNKFEKVILTSMRARELAEGINVTAEMEGRKITSIAMDELGDGSLTFAKEEEEDEDGK
ncbi:MAG: DNA-directed RNA polymerase subunit omega [candidate division FCPU426 bacterium]